MGTMLDPQMREKMLNGPALALPPGQVRNLENPENLRAACIAVASAMLALSTFAVAIQVYTKTRLLKKTKLEDYLLYAAYLVFIGTFAPFAILVGEVPAGVHQWNMRVRDVIEFQKWFFLGTVSYAFIVALIKTAIILMTLRTFNPRGVKGFLYWSATTLMWVNIAFWTAAFFMIIFRCNPVQKAWDVTIREGRCMEKISLYTAHGTFNVVSDLWMLLLPQTAIWKLRLPMKRKLGLSSLFLFGFCASAIAALRLYYTVRLFNETDQTYVASEMGLWIWPELAFGLLIACLPSFPKFFRTPFFTRIGTAVRSVWGSRGGAMGGSVVGQSRREGGRTPAGGRDVNVSQEQLYRGKGKVVYLTEWEGRDGTPSPKKSVESRDHV